MILLIDNYDSFVYNLYQLIGTYRPDIRVVRNREITPPEIEAMNPEAVFLSPGPGRPEDSGVCLPVIESLNKPIFGVCLGHQAICQTFGGTVTYAKKLMHGKPSTIFPDPASQLFAGMKPFQAARYHSLAAPEALLPDCLMVAARTADGEVMAVEHREKPIFGVQFHPESILTPQGGQIIEHFFTLIGGNQND